MQKVRDALNAAKTWCNDNGPSCGALVGLAVGLMAILGG